MRQMVLLLVTSLGAGAMPPVAAASDFYQINDCEQRLDKVWRQVHDWYSLGEADFDRVAAHEGIPAHLLKAIVLAEQADYNLNDYGGDFLGYLGDDSRSVGLVQLQAGRIVEHRLMEPEPRQLQAEMGSVAARLYPEGRNVDWRHVERVARANIASDTLFNPSQALHLAAREIKFILESIRSSPGSDYTRAFFASGRFSDVDPYRDVNPRVFAPQQELLAEDIAKMLVAKAVALPYNTSFATVESPLIRNWPSQRFGPPTRWFTRDGEFVDQRGKHPYRNALVQSQNAFTIAGCLTMPVIEGYWQNPSGFGVIFQRYGDDFVGYLRQPTAFQLEASYRDGEQVAWVKRIGGRVFDGSVKIRRRGVESEQWAAIRFTIGATDGSGTTAMRDSDNVTWIRLGGSNR